MDWIRHRTWEREFDDFAAQAWEPLLRTGYLMTGDAKDAEDLVQETLLKVARRWSRVRSMDHPAAYARRILINLILHDAGRRSRQRAELWPQDSRAEAADDSAARALQQVDDLAEFRWALARLHPRQRAVLVLRYWVSPAATAFTCCTHAVHVPFGIKMKSIISGGIVMICGGSCLRWRRQCR